MNDQTVGAMLRSLHTLPVEILEQIHHQTTVLLNESKWSDEDREAVKWFEAQPKPFWFQGHWYNQSKVDRIILEPKCGPRSEVPPCRAICVLPRVNDPSLRWRTCVYCARVAKHFDVSYPVMEDGLYGIGYGMTREGL